jgi:agmatinase
VLARFAIVPCPHEATTSYGHGTKAGPAAIIKAFPYVENFDEELERVMVPAGALEIGRPVPVARLESRVADLLNENKIPIILGGEHSLTPFAVKAFAKKHKHLSVLQLDAHADLRDSYQGSKNSHACALRRVLEICPAVQVGIRSLSIEEWEWARKTGQIDKIHFAQKLGLVNKIEDQLHKDVYITIDADVFDPSVIPATGTPEPGGLFWYEVLDILKGVCAAKNVVGFDVVELSPRKGDIASDFTVAKLIHKILGYISAS